MSAFNGHADGPAGAVHEWLEQATAYAIGALDGRDEAAFVAHLADCEICRHEVATMREVAGLLADAPDQLEPPPGLRDRILAEARQVRPLTAPSGESAGTLAGMELTRPPAEQDAYDDRGGAYDAPVPDIGYAQPPRQAPSSRERAVAPPPRKGSRIMAIGGWFAAAAAIGGVAVLGSMYQRQREDLSSFSRIASQLRHDLVARDSIISTRDSLVASLMNPDVQLVTLVSTGRPPSARLFVNRQAHRVILAAYALPPAPAGRAYQLWGLRKEGGSPVSLGVFNTRPDSGGVKVMDIPPGVRIVASAITEEPAGGSAAPTSTPFLIAQWKGE